MSNATEKLTTLNKKILTCSRCPLHENRQHVVPGEGSAIAKIMFIGEGPGAKEDETGHPFVGASGKFLDEMLASINLKRSDIYIANVVKCRPPKNRDPLPEEVATCWPWLLEQIKIIKPLLIVTLGRYSMERFFPQKKISQVHGKALRREVKDIGRQVFYTSFHPAAALYNGSMRETLIQDFKRIPKVLKAIEKENKKEN